MEQKVHASTLRSGLVPNCSQLAAISKHNASLPFSPEKGKHVLYLQELSWKISKRNPSERYSADRSCWRLTEQAVFMFEINVYAFKTGHVRDKKTFVQKNIHCDVNSRKIVY
jgi:hypothetical protein